MRWVLTLLAGTVSGLVMLVILLNGSISIPGLQDLHHLFTIPQGEVVIDLSQLDDTATDSGQQITRQVSPKTVLKHEIIQAPDTPDFEQETRARDKIKIDNENAQDTSTRLVNVVAVSPDTITAPSKASGLGPRSKIAIILDDMGTKRESTLRALSLPPEVTLSFLPFGIHTAELSERARDQGHELFLHLPMEPLSRQHNPGPDALLVRDDMITLSEKIDRNLSRFDNYAAINSHMGSRFSVWEPGVRRLMEILHNRGIGFIDSYTTHRSVAYTIADELGVPAFRRDVFLDNDPQPEKILESIAKLTEIAGKRGYALAIAHPHPTTVQVLNAWITSPGFALRHQLVPASQLLGLDIALPDNTASGLSSAGKN